MRLLLDAHVSGRAIGQPLRDAGHDVLALCDDPRKDMDDEAVLALATQEERILVTFDVSDFPSLVRHWAHVGREHAGCAIVVGMDHREFGSILRALTRILAAHPDPSEWRNLAFFVDRTSAQP